jgi:hypothetical protein
MPTEYTANDLALIQLDRGERPDDQLDMLAHVRSGYVEKKGSGYVLTLAGRRRAQKLAGAEQGMRTMLGRRGISCGIQATPKK